MSRNLVIAVRVAGALNLIGALVKWYSLAFLFPTAIAIVYGESPWPFVVPGLAAGLLGFGIERATSGKEGIGAREGFLVVTVVWLLVPALGALPYLLSGEPQLRNPANALFESMSGFTTTGSSVLTDIPALSNSLLMWRQFTQWVGGMGIVVLGLAVLPRLRVGGRRALFHAESPGPDTALTESMLTVARRFLGLYVGITVALVAVLALLGWTRLDREMTFFDAVAHGFSTIPTGGFSPRARSIEEFGAATQWAIIPFMILGGTSFVLLYLAIIRQRPRALAHDDEFRAYGFVLSAASVIVLVDIAGAGVAEGELAVRQAVFNTVSVFTTTGFANADFNEWTALTAFVLVGGMILSASAGSTAGGIKLVRHVLIAKTLRRELVQTVHPELVVPIRLSGSPGRSIVTL